VIDSKALFHGIEKSSASRIPISAFSAMAKAYPKRSRNSCDRYGGHISRLGLMATPPNPFSINEVSWETNLSLEIQEFQIQIAHGRDCCEGFSKTVLMFFNVALLVYYAGG
jgi:hypothetical protein